VPQSSAPDRYGKLPSTGGNNGIIGSGSSGDGSTGGSSGSNDGGGNNSGTNGNGGRNNNGPNGSGGISNSSGSISNGGEGASRGGGYGSSVSSILSSRVATTTDNSLGVVSRNSCKYPCLNGGTCQGSICTCRQGYTGENCGDRKFTEQNLSVPYVPRKEY